MRNSTKLFAIVSAFPLFISMSISHGEGISILTKGMKLETTHKVKVRATPPEQSFAVFVKKPGEVIGALPIGKIIEVKDVTTVSSPLAKDVWVKILSEQKIDGKLLSGWVYFGDEKKAKNFKISNDK